MEDLDQAMDSGAEYGPFSAGSGPVGTAEGRMNGGGWINGPMPVSSESNYGGSAGPWMPAIGDDPQGSPGSIGAPGTRPGDSIWDMVNGRGSRF